MVTASRDLLLQPVSAGDVIDRALRLYRHNFTSLLAIAALPGLTAITGGLLTVFTQDHLGFILLGGWITWGVAPVVNLMVIGALTRVIADHLMHGAELSFRRTWRLLRQRFARLLGVSMIGWMLVPVSALLVGGVALFGAGIAGALLAPGLSQGGTVQWVIAVPIFIVLGVLFIIGGLLVLELYARVLMMPMASLIEGQPVGSSISRGLRLGAKTWSKVLAILAFEFCLTYSIALALGVPLGLYAATEGFPWSIETVGSVSNILLQIGALMTAPVPIVAYALLYFDNRVRKDGFDVEVLARDIAA
jgi:hypothetical protein